MTFLDDFIKIRFKQNEGLKPMQKIVFQILIAAAVSVYSYFNRFILASVLAPFTLKEIHLGVFSIFLNAAVFLGFTNSVNLTDGLDGLAGKVSVSYLAVFSAIVGLLIYYFGSGEETMAAEYLNIMIFCGALGGAVIGFLCYNGFPAKIFMGDTGSLAIGGALACLAVVTRLTLIIPFLGVMFVITSVSVILQVAYYKKTKKRIFLMAPLHHHFEKKGVHENRIVTVYNAITLMTGLIVIIITVAVNGLAA